MLAKTHLALGYAACLLVTRPSDPGQLAVCFGTATIYSVISDIDATTSESRKNLGKVLTAAGAGIAILAASEYFFDAGIVNRIQDNELLLRIVSGLMILLFICIFGEHCPHRSFMHSFAGVAAISAATALITPYAVKYAAVSMLSHIAADLLNKKKVRLFYPLRSHAFSLGLCSADGAVNMFLLLAAGTFTVFHTVYLIFSFTGIRLHL